MVFWTLRWLDYTVEGNSAITMPPDVMILESSYLTIGLLFVQKERERQTTVDDKETPIFVNLR